MRVGSRTSSLGGSYLPSYGAYFFPEVCSAVCQGCESFPVTGCNHDEHAGCIGSAGYERCPELDECIQPAWRAWITKMCLGFENLQIVFNYETKELKDTIIEGRRTPPTLTVYSRLAGLFLTFQTGSTLLHNTSLISHHPIQGEDPVYWLPATQKKI
jgi:hypothetical protein